MAAATAISRATFPIFDPIFYIKFILKNGEIWRGEGGGGGSQIWHSWSLGDFNASVANVLQTSCESEWEAKERQRFTRSTSTGTQSIKISLKAWIHTLYHKNVNNLSSEERSDAKLWKYKHKYCITPSVFIFEQDLDNFLMTCFGAQSQNIN